MVREIVDATARLTWITAGYGWISIVAPIAIASPAYFGGKLSFGELMVAVGGFYQVNQSLRWFVDNFALLADWRAALSRVIKFREVLLMSENGSEQENRALHLRDFANHLRLHYGVASKGKKAVLDAIVAPSANNDGLIVFEMAELPAPAWELFVDRYTARNQRELATTWDEELRACRVGWGRFMTQPSPRPPWMSVPISASRFGRAHFSSQAPTAWQHIRVRRSDSCREDPISSGTGLGSSLNWSDDASRFSISSHHRGKLESSV